MTKPFGWLTSVVRLACEIREATPGLDAETATRLAELQTNAELDDETGQLQIEVANA